MWFLKACPRCHGDLVFDEDDEGAYLICVQCGHILSLAQERALGVRVHRHGVSSLNEHAHSAHAPTGHERVSEPLMTVR